MIPAILFVAIALLLSACALMAILGVGQLALSGVDAIERDGLARGRAAPAWSLVDSTGVVRHSPPAVPLQLIVFADHSLKSFPSVVAGLRALRDGTPAAPPRAVADVGPLRAVADVGPLSAAAVAYPDPADLEIVILLRGPSEIAEPVIGQLGLADIPVLTGSAARYADYNVRVIPFAIFVDSGGRVRASSLVNHDWQVHKLRQIAAIPLEPGEGDDPRSAELTRARRSVLGRARARRPAAVPQAVQQAVPQAVPQAATRLSGTAV